MRKFRWCFIGTGVYASKIAEMFLASDLHEIVSVYTRREESGLFFSEKFGGTYFSSPEAAIQREQVDAVYIATPPSSHYQYAKLALSLGKPVLCEKAFTINEKEAIELVRLSQEKNLYLVEGMWTWFSPVANQVREWVHSGILGKIQSVKMDFLCDVRNYAKRIFDPNVGGGALLDIGLYPLYFAYMLFGEPKSISCKGTLDGGVDIFDEIQYECASGLKISIALSIVEPTRKEYIEIVGEKGSIFIPAFHSAQEAFLRLTGKDEIHLKTQENLKINEFNIVASEIQNKKVESDYLKKEDSIQIMKFVDLCRKQINLVYPFE